MPYAILWGSSQLTYLRQSPLATSYYSVPRNCQCAWHRPIRHAGRYDDGREDAKLCMGGLIAIAVLITYLTLRQTTIKNRRTVQVCAQEHIPERVYVMS